MITTNADRNPPLLVIASGLRAALFPIPVITLFWKDEIGMSLADIMWLQAIFGATVVLMEFPSGYIADQLGYRRSLSVGGSDGMGCICPRPSLKGPFSLLSKITESFYLLSTK